MKLDIKGTSLELAEIIKDEPQLIEKDLLKEGNDIVAIYQDANFTDSFQNFRELKREIFNLALEDLAMGGITLRTSMIGLTFREGKIKTFISPLSVQPSGNLMFSITLKETAAFKNWRNDEGADIPQENLNAAIYRIIIALAEIL